jgi:Na+/proline symporter
MHLLANANFLAGRFTWIDWGIVFASLVLTTWLGHKLAGHQRNFRDYFLGGRKLPWYAVSGSIVATQLSAITFLALPAIVYKPGGDIRYIQLAVFGQLIARFVVGFVLLPQYYKREIYSPYDYMAQRLGANVRLMTTALFSLTAVLTRSARIYLTAVVVELLLQVPLGSFEHATGIRPITSAIWIIGGISILWSAMGGINTVVWTDVILFVIYLIGAIVSLGAVGWYLHGGFHEIFSAGYAAGKFRFFDFDPSPTKMYTIYTAVIAASFDGIGGLGTDQTVAQRLFCCKNAVQARWALISSWSGICVPFICLFLGAGLFVYFQQHPLGADAAHTVAQRPDSIFPIFILTVLPTGVAGFIIAAVFAAALASMESVQAALSQTTMSAFYLPARRRYLAWQAQGGVELDALGEERRNVWISRLLVVLWGCVLCAMAQFAEHAAALYPSIIDLAGAMAGYAGGALLAGFLLAFLPLGIDGRGYLFSAPLGVLCVFAVAWHDLWAQWTCAAAGALLLAIWLRHLLRSRWMDVPRTLFLAAGAVLALLLCRYGYFTSVAKPGTKLSLAWPWYGMVGMTVSLIWGYVLANKLQPKGPIDESQDSSADDRVVLDREPVGVGG